MNIRGRRKKEVIRDRQVKVRLTKDEDIELDMVCFETDKSRAEVVRDALKLYFRAHKYLD